MRISFDLDDTLICYQPGTPRERRLPWYWRWIVGDEPLRLGARSLMSGLQERGWELWVYTTSQRSPGLVRRWLRGHGIRVSGVINQDTHHAHLRDMPRESRPSKNPAAFGIALHVDDSEGVRMEGNTHGFEVVVVSPDDDAWTKKVWLAAEAVQRCRSNP